MADAEELQQVVDALAERKEQVENGENEPQLEAASVKEELSEEKIREIKEKIADVTIDDDDEDGPRTELTEDLREHVNIIFIGHVDAGKSTIAGNLLYLTGMVDERTIAKYEREANEKKHGTWFLAYIMDTNEEERAKGKTVEVGRAHFATQKKRFTILDAPGHKNYVPNMIGGAAQADVGILVISARKGEFEAGFEGQGQTREHATLAKTLGVRQLVIAINKLDIDGYQKERWDEIQSKLTPFLRSVGYNPKTDISWIPVSGYHGDNIKVPLGDKAIWYNGPTLLQLLDDLQPIERSADGPVRLPVLDKYKSRGYTVLIGKIESGTIQKGDRLIVYPNKHVTEVMFIELETGDVLKAKAGENVNVGIKDVEPTDVSPGFLLCSIEDPVTVVKEFEAQLAIVDLLPHKPILSAGYTAVIHVHTAVEEVSIDELISVLNKKTKKPSSRKPTFVRKGDIVTVRISLAKPICMELFSKLQQLGRFTVRDEGKTIAIGKTLKLYETNEIVD